MRYLFFLLLSTSLYSQGYIIDYKPTDTSKYDIPFHVVIGDEVIYTLRSNYNAYVVRSKTDGTVVDKINLDADTLTAFCAYGNKINDKIQVFTLVKSDSHIYLVYRLYDSLLNMHETDMFWIDRYSTTAEAAYASDIEQYRSQGIDKSFVIFNLYKFNGGASPRYIAMRFDNDGKLITHKQLELNRGITGILYDGQLSLIAYNDFKVIYDDDFNFVKEVGIFEHIGTNDTIYHLWNSIIQADGKNIRLGKTRLVYNVNQPNSHTFIGRCISEVDGNLRIKGKVNFTELPMTLESDGTARYSGSLFYKDGYYYTLFEFQDYNAPFPSPNTLYVTKYDTDFNIVEDTYFVFNRNYRLFVKWAELTNQLSFSGYYWDIDNDYKLGGYIIGLNSDGSQPLNTQNNLIEAMIKVRGNPATDYLILSTEDIKGNEYEVRLYDLQGRLIRTTRDWSNGSIRIPVSDQASDTYIYQVWYKNRPLISGKFIKI